MNIVLNKIRLLFFLNILIFSNFFIINATDIKNETNINKENKTNKFENIYILEGYLKKSDNNLKLLKKEINYYEKIFTYFLKNEIKMDEEIIQKLNNNINNLYEKYEIEEQNNINIRKKFSFYRKTLYHLKNNKFKYLTLLSLYLLGKGLEINLNMEVY